LFLDNRQPATMASSSSHNYQTSSSIEKPGFTEVTATSREPSEIGHIYKAKNRFGFSWAVDQEPSSFAATPNASNADFDPVPPSKRTWTWMAFVAYWMADAWAVSNWEVGMCNSFVVHGMSRRLTLCSFFHDCCWS